MHFETAYDVGDVLWHVDEDPAGELPPSKIELVSVNQMHLYINERGKMSSEIRYKIEQQASLQGVCKLEDIRFTRVKSEVFGYLKSNDDFYKTKEEALGAAIRSLTAYKALSCRKKQRQLKEDIADMRRHLKDLPKELAKAQEQLRTLTKELKAFEKEKQNEKRK